MRRFAQKSQEPSPENLREFGQEGLSQFEYNQKIEKYKESEK